MRLTRALLVLSATALVAVAAYGGGLGDDGLFLNAMQVRTDSMTVSSPTARCGAPPGSPVIWVDGTDPLNAALPANNTTLGAAGALVVNKGSLGGTFSAAATAEPLFKSSCFGPSAGSKKGCIRFDGTNDVLTSSLAAATFNFLHFSDYTCAALFRVPLYSPEVTYPIMATAGTATSQVGHILAWDDASSAEFRLRVEQKNGGSVTNNRILTSSVFDPQLWERLIVTYDDALTTDAIVGYLSNVSRATSGAQLAVPVATAPSNTLRLGSFGNAAGGFLDGDLAELVCYQSTFDATARAQLDNWMACVETGAPYGPRPGSTAVASTSALCDPADDPCFVGVMGDSITATTSPSSWANGFLQTTTYPRTHIFRNVAVGGTTIEIARTAQWSSSLSLAGIHVLMMLIGTNDIGLNSTPAVDILADIDEVADSANAQGVKVVTVAILPRRVNYGGAYATLQPIQDAVNVGLAAAADGSMRFHAAVYDDMEDLVTADNLRAAFDSGDGLHPNQTGQDALGGLINAAVDLTP